MAPGATTAADAVSRALRAPLTINEMSMRLATWTYKEPGGSKVRLLITAEVERSADQALEYTTGLLLVDGNSRTVTTNVETKPLRQNDANTGVATFAGSLLIDPGTYLVRFAAADSEGRLGSVERKVVAWAMDGKSLTVGDLLIGQATGNAPIAPAIEPVIGNGQLAAMMEVYHPALAPDALQATLDVVADENARPLLTMPLQIAGGPSSEVGVLQGVINTSALPPGRYLARASVRQGGKPQGHIVRPFRVLAPTRAVNDASPAHTVLPAAVLSAMLASLPAVDVKELVAANVLASVLTAAEQSRPAAKSAFATARAGNLGPAALDALSAGDQVSAAFLRGVDFFSRGLHDRALQQLQVAMQQAPTFAPARLYLGAVLSQGNRHREAASLLQSAGDLVLSAPVARLAAVSWLRAGDAPNAIAALEKANASGDASVRRTLAMAYVAADRPRDALPLLMQLIESNPKDQEALLAALFAIYSQHVPARQPETLAADRARAQTWARAYAALKGEHMTLVDAWMAYLR
jgi:tetratricopeptide (TPR) repeat protein